MKKLYAGLFCCILCLFNTTIAQIKINPSFYGINFWGTQYDNAPFGAPGVSFNTDAWTKVLESGVKMMRVGGANYDNTTGDYAAPTDGLGNIVPQGYVKIVDDIRSNGFEPMITAPFRDDHIRSLAEQAHEAAEIVRVLNIVHKRNVKYFIISNEPNKDQGYGSIPDIDYARKVRDYVMMYSVEMKKVDPSIKIIGPELNFANDNILDLLFCDPIVTNTTSIKGLIPAVFQGVSTGLSTLYFVDYLSFHTYAGYESTFTGATSVRGGYANIAEYYKGKYKYAYDRWVSGDGTLGNNDRTATLKLVIDEFNMGEIPAITSALTTASVKSEAANGNTFLAGQAIVDIMAGMLSVQDNTSTGTPAYEFSNLWAIKETQSWGYLDGSGNDRKSTYWHYYMMANYFRGIFYPNIVTFPGYTNPERCIKAYGCKSNNYIAVIVMNQMQNVSGVSPYTDTYNSTGTTYDFKINFNNSAPSTAGVADFAFAMNQSAWTSDYTGTIENKSSAILFFDCSSSTTSPNLIGRYDLKENDLSNGTTGLSNYDLATHSTGTIPAILDMPQENGGCVTDVAFATLTAPTGGTSYTWYKLPNLTSSIASGAGNTYSSATAGTYQVEIAGGCAPVRLSATVHESSPIIQPSVTITQYCNNGTDQALLSVLPTTGPTYTWSPGTTPATGSNVSANPSGPQTYTVTATQSSCTSTDQIAVVPKNNSDDLYIKDDAADIGAEPNNTVTGGVFWASPDIWITQTEISTDPADHVAAEYKTDGTPNYVHARIRNLGSTTATGQVFLYFAKASLGLAWPINWNDSENSGLAMADQIGIPVTVTVGPSSYTDITIPWFAPNYIDFNIFPGDPKHFCLLARIITGCGTDNTGMDFIEGTDIGYNTMWNKKIAWRNITVDDTQPNLFNGDDGDCEAVLARNVLTTTANIDIAFRVPVEDYSESQLTDGAIFVNIGQNIYEKWVAGGKQGTGIQEVNNTCHKLEGVCLHKHNIDGKPFNPINDKPYELQITQADAFIGNLNFAPAEFQSLCIRYRFGVQPPARSKHEFHYDIIEYTHTDTSTILTGGQRYIINRPDCPLPNAGPDITIGRQCKTLLHGGPIEDGAFYNWYNARTGELLGQTSNLSVAPMATTTYELEILSANGCVGYDQVTVSTGGVACQPVCGTPTYNNQTLASNTHIDNVEIVINGTLKVPNNVTLRITDGKINFTENASIEVLPGGKLVIVNSQLRACDITKPWKGISIKSNNILNSEFKIKSSSITDAINPIVMNKINEAEIRNNIFADGINAITMDKCQDFTIAKNQFYTYDVGIYSIRGKVDTKSIIKKNYFYKVKTAVLLEKGNLASLEIKCNYFDDYKDYAIYSDSTILNDQGSAGEGAGNLFISTSTKVNNQIRHKGNSIQYYFNPDDPFTLSAAGGMTAITHSSLLNGDCAGYDVRESEDDFEEENGVIAEYKNIESATLNSIPNPASDKVTFVYTIPGVMQTGEIRIMNILGELIAKYPVSPDSKSIEVDCSGLNNGIYLYSLVIDNKLINTKKMVITK